MKKRLCAIFVVVVFALASWTLAQLGSFPANATFAAGKTTGDKTTAPNRVALYAAVGAELTQYDVDVNDATLVKRGSVRLPADVQEAAQHPSKQYLYIAWSNGGPSSVAQGS